MDKPPAITYGLVTGQLKLILTAAIAYALGKGYLTAADATIITTIATGAGALAIPFVWSWYTNMGTKKVPANSVAIMPNATEAPTVGDNVAGRVVGALLMAILLNGLLLTGHSYAQSPAPKVTAPRAVPAPAATLATKSFLDIIRNWVANDIEGAITLATQIPELQDPTGKQCWATFRGIGDVITAHPLPVTLKLASDVQAARLVAMALKKVCVEPACAQVWLDMQNQVAALATIGVPFTLNSICSKVL